MTREVTSPVRPVKSYLPSHCAQCGTIIRAGRKLCDVCLVGQPQRASRRAITIGRRRAEAGVKDGRSTQRQRAEKGRTAAEQHAARQAWEADVDALPSRTVFIREIAPRVARLSNATIMQATGLSRSAANMSRRGTFVPHPRYWDRLRTAIAEEDRSGEG